MSVFGKAFDFLGGGGVAGMAGSVMSGMFNRRSAASANEFTEKQMKNKHQWQAKDLEKAGLNRILSMSNGAPMGSSAQASIQDPQLGSVFNQQKQANTAQKLANSNIDVNSQTARKLKAEANSANAMYQRLKVGNEVLFSKTKDGKYRNKEALSQHLFNTLNLGVNNPLSRFLIETEDLIDTIGEGANSALDSVHRKRTVDDFRRNKYKNRRDRRNRKK